MKKLRLLKVIVQPVFLVDDGSELTEMEHPPIVIPASEWNDYSSKRFPAEVEEWQRKLNDEGASR